MSESKSHIERYGYWDGELWSDVDGEWVKWEDAARLKEELRALEDNRTTWMYRAQKAEGQLEITRDKLSRAVVQCLEREKELRHEWDAMYEGLEEIVACRYHTDGIAEALLAYLPVGENSNSVKKSH